VTLKIGSLFSGIGGLELGLEWALDCETAWQVEQDPFCRSVLSQWWPTAERFDDVRTVGRANLTPVWLICGGFPCQDTSSAGKGAGLGGARSGLWFEMARIIAELCPQWVVVENPTSGAARWVDVVQTNLEQLGYASLPVTIQASDCGALHRRSRTFVVANANQRVGDVHAGPWQEGWEDPCDTLRASDERIATHTHGLRSLTAEQNGNHSTGGGMPWVAADDDIVSSGARSESDSRGGRTAPSHEHGVDAAAHTNNVETGIALRTRPELDGGGQTTTHVDSPELRLESGRLSGERGAAEARIARLAARSKAWPWSVAGVDPLVHGVSGRLVERERRALGNSCTPQQAEVVGHVIRQLCEASGQAVAA
jgi:site-specific DNA-cytosine methylase